MKYIKNRFIQVALLLLVILTVASCKKIIYGGINNNPVLLSNPQPANLLPSVIEFTGYQWGGDASRFPSLFMQYVNGLANQSVNYYNYSVGTGEVDAMWTNFYAGGIMNNANQIVIIATKSGLPNYEAIGKILLANSLGQVTDFWGDAPYSQAFMGASGILDPKYDPQQAIYTDIDGLLSDAISEITTAPADALTPSGDDIMYGGDMSAWLAYAYSLKAKFYIHLAKVDPSNYAKCLVAAANGFNDPSQDALVPFAGGATSANPWNQFNGERGDIGFPDFISTVLGVTDDPRSAVYTDGAGDLGDIYGAPNASVPLMTYEELLFDEAEAAYQTGDKASAATFYTSAVSQSLLRTTGDDTYGTSPEVARTAATITLMDIMDQKYIADYLEPETWTDWRRTGFPALVPNPDGVLGGQIPRSLLYPQSEVLHNTNTPANTTLLRRVYWDVATQADAVTNSKDKTFVTKQIFSRKKPTGRFYVKPIHVVKN